MIYTPTLNRKRPFNPKVEYWRPGISQQLGPVYNGSGLLGDTALNLANRWINSSGVSIQGDGVLGTAVIAGQGPFGPCFKFGGTTQDFIQIMTNQQFFQGINEYTLSMWVYLTALTTQRCFWGETNSSGGGTWFFGMEATTNKLNLSISIGSFQSTVGATALTAGVWTHVALAMGYVSQGKCTIYLNGSPDATRSLPNVGNFTGGRTYLGSWYGSGAAFNPMDGMIDNVAIYSRCLQDTEIQRLYMQQHSYYGQQGRQYRYPSVSGLRPRSFGVVL